MTPCEEELAHLKKISQSMDKLLGLTDPFYVPDDRFRKQTSVSLSETAQRIGAPLLYDKRGEVIWFDDFEAPTLRWKTATSGAGAAVALSTANAHFGDQSVLLTAGTDANKLSEIIQYHDFFGQRKVGLSVALSWFNNASDTGHSFSIILAKVKDGTLYFGELNISPNLNTVYYYGNDAAYHAYKGLPFVYTDTGAWYNFKLVVDFERNEYVRMMFSDKEIDLSNIALRSTASALQDQMYTDIINYGIAANVVKVYVDDVVVTINEPKGG